MIAVDTNVLVYMVDNSQLQKQQAAKDLVKNLHTQGNGILLWQVAVEFVAVLRRLQQHGKLSDPDVSAPLSRIRRLFPIVLPTEAVLDGAISLAAQHSLSHWDSMLWRLVLKPAFRLSIRKILLVGRTMEPCWRSIRSQSLHEFAASEWLNMPLPLASPSASPWPSPRPWTR